MLMSALQPAGTVPAGSILSALHTRPPEAVERDTFDPTEAKCWLTRGRSIEHASELARIWRAFPDLPATAPLDDRMARGRERIAAMKPLNDAISAAVEAERQARNFALMEQHLVDGTIAGFGVNGYAFAVGAVTGMLGAADAADPDAADAGGDR